MSQYRRAICGIFVFCVLLFPCFVLAEQNGNGQQTNSSTAAVSPDPNNPAAPATPATPAAPAVDGSVVFHTHVVIPLKYLKADQAKAMFASLMPNSQIRVEAMNNLLIVMGNEEDLNQVNDILAQLDVPPRQVMFEAEIVEISRDNLKKAGISWGSDTSLPEAPRTDGSAFQVRLGNSQYGVNFQAAVNRLLEKKKGRLLASPRIAALDGQTAQIMIGDKLAVESRQKDSSGYTFVTVTYIDVGIKLEITPVVNADGTITTHIKPEVSNKTDTTASGNPNLRTRQAETTLRVKNGETIVLGGLIQREETSDVQKVPILGDIPIIKGLFRSTEREKRETELIILITPKMLDT